MIRPKQQTPRLLTQSQNSRKTHKSIMQPTRSHTSTRISYVANPYTYEDRQAPLSKPLTVTQQKATINEP